MVTLISMHNSEGEVGRCDAKCYGAEHDECDCVCQGRNHGAGRQAAEQNTAELAESWMEHARREAAGAGREPPSFELGDAATHEALFDIPGPEAEAG